MNSPLMDQRRNYIEKRLITDGSIKVSDLSRFFGVSSETIRKDLIYLEEKGIAKKAYGGAVALSGVFEPSFKLKSVTHPEEKERIAAAALQHIRSGMTVLLDAGSTVFALAKAMAILGDVTVFTNGLKAAQVLDEFGITTYLLGGRIRHNSNAIVGSWALRSLEEIRVDLSVLGTSGFRGRTGPCVENFPEAEIKAAMIRSAGKTIVLGDASKADVQSVIEFAKWRDISEFITDSRIEPDVLSDIRQHTNVNVV